jgi:hypothetical protein
LERSGEPTALEVLKDFANSGISLEEPVVILPTSPKHPEGVVTGTVD